MRRFNFPIVGAVLASLLTLSVSHSAFAQTYPNKPVKMIIPFPPGGTLDSVGRQLAQKLSVQLGQQFIVENRPGGNGIIGADVVAKAPTDGYTLLFNASTFTTAPMTMKQVPYSVENDFSPVALVAKAPLSVSINKNLPVTDVKSLIAYAKANPGKMTFAVGSVGSAGHLATELLKRTGGLDYTVVPYKGTAPAFQDLIGGQIDGFIDPILGSLQYHKSGLLRVIAVTSAKPSGLAPGLRHRRRHAAGEDRQFPRRKFECGLSRLAGGRRLGRMAGPPARARGLRDPVRLALVHGTPGQGAGRERGAGGVLGSGHPGRLQPRPGRAAVRRAGRHPAG